MTDGPSGKTARDGASLAGLQQVGLRHPAAELVRDIQRNRTGIPRRTFVAEGLFENETFFRPSRSRTNPCTPNAGVATSAMRSNSSTNASQRVRCAGVKGNPHRSTSRASRGLGAESCVFSDSHTELFTLRCRIEPPVHNGA